jgi:hypothetical protein
MQRQTQNDNPRRVPVMNVLVPVLVMVVMMLLMDCMTYA